MLNIQNITHLACISNKLLNFTKKIDYQSGLKPQFEMLLPMTSTLTEESLILDHPVDGGCHHPTLE